MYLINFLMISIPYYGTSNFVVSNFSAHTVEYKGATFATVQHAFGCLEISSSPQTKTTKKWNEITIEILTDIIRKELKEAR